MSDKKVAFMVSEELSDEIERLKKDKYFNKPYSDMFRDLMDAGIKAIKKKEGK